MDSKCFDTIHSVINEAEPKQRALPYLELDSMMLSQVVEVAKRIGQSDISSTHIQNWVRRNYLSHPQKKKYSREQVANILLINEMRNILSLEEASHFLNYVKKDILCESNDSFPLSKLYQYYSQIFDLFQVEGEKSLYWLEKEVEEILGEEKMSEEEHKKAATTLVILNLLARANLYKKIAKRWLNDASPS